MENVGNNQPKKIVWITLSNKEEVQFTLSNDRTEELLNAIGKSQNRFLRFKEENIYINLSQVVKIFITE